MISLDYTMLIQIVNFLLLIFILNFLLYKPILGIIDKRNKQLSDSEEEIRNLDQSVVDRMAEYEEKIKKAKLDAIEQKNMLLKEGAENAKGIIDAARDEVPQIMSQFQEKIDAEINEGRRILSDQSRKISFEIAEKILGRNIR